MKSYNQAKKILINAKLKIKDEIININSSLNRIVSENILSNVNYPAGDNAAFDGFVVKAQDTKKISKKNAKHFKILGSLAAGDKPKFKYKKLGAVEVMTGALIPRGFDTIIPIEKIRFDKNKKNILLNEKLIKYSHVRFAGSDFRIKDIIVKKGTQINSNHILALKTLGIQKLKVKKIPSILFFSTGNEISEKTEIPNWKVRNSNSYYIKSLAKKFSFNFIDGGILRDEEEKLFKNKLNKLIKSDIELIITSGAVSAGKYDFIPNVVKSLPLQTYLKSVAIRPGKPFMFAKIRNKSKAIFGLPGNPMSSAACFRFFVYPYLCNSLQTNEEKPLKAVLKNSFSKKKDFTRFIKCKLSTNQKGVQEVEVLKGQESFRIKSFVNANSWGSFPSGKSKFKKGEIIDCFPANFSSKNFY